MEGRISMSEKELYELQVIKEVEEKKISVAKAAKLLKISLRQLYKIRKAFRQKGAKRAVSRKLGALGNHKIPEDLEKLVLHFFKKEEPADFGPTLAHKYMVKSMGF
jgi:transposase-like protein